MVGVSGSLYGIPDMAPRVVKYNPLDNPIAHIGSDLNLSGSDTRYANESYNGAITDRGVIYCPPEHEDHGILKIDTNTDMVTKLDANLLPDRGHSMWASCALALDGCIYFMPCCANRIMKLDPNNSDVMSSVGDCLGEHRCNKYIGSVVGIDGCVYGMPYYHNRIVKYNPINGITSVVQEDLDDLECFGNGALGRDGCIYGRVLKIDTTNNSHCMVGHTVESDPERYGWGDGIMGIDGCIYWPPVDATHIMKYDPHSNLTSLVGDDLGDGDDKWSGGCAAPDGVIYCLPYNATRILVIDPLKEYTLSLKDIMEEHPEKL